MRSKIVKALTKVVILGGMALAIATGMPGNTLEAEAATTTQLKEFRKELKTMMLTGDATAHDVEKYNMTYSEAYSVWKDLVASDCKLAYNSGCLYESTTKNSSGKIKTYQVMGMDDGYLDRYENVCNAVDEVMANIDDDMTDLDKVLYIHEYLVENVYYKNENSISHTAGGPLGLGYGVCQGYTKAMQLLLDEVGVENAFVSSTAMNHGWAYINLDGEWYHTDVLWDDSRKGSNSEYQHRFLLKNDNEFQNVSTNKHYSWYSANCDEASTSTRFSNWFVHDVAGTMRYYEGFWYFQQGNNIMKAKVDGTEMSTVLQATGTVTLKNLEDGVISYTVSGKTMTFDLADATENNYAQVGSGAVTDTDCPSEWSIEGIDWTSADNWQVGQYRPDNGAYLYFKGRICLKELLEVEEKEYEIHVLKENYHVLIREFDKNGKMVKSNNLEDGAEFVPTADTVSVGISLYNVADAGVTFDTYKKLLVAGNISITVAQVEELPETDDTVQVPETEEPKSGLEAVNWTDITNWQVGHYTPDTGAYYCYKGRVCLKELVEVEIKEYKIHMEEENYHVLIREFDANGKMVKSNNLEDGAVFVPTADTVSVGVSLYNTENATVTFNTYNTLISAGAVSITAD